MKRLYIILLSSILFCSCNKEVLDKAPLDRLSDAAVWTDINLASTFENEVYNGVEDWVTGGLATSAMVDDAYSNFDWCGEREVTHGLLTPDQPTGVGMVYNKGGNGRWAYYYDKIRAANLFLSKINNVPGDEALKSRMTGEVYFLRAYFYAELVNA
ncbi:MAG TPA: RagB/SusD family nutrient uptake outer membrane protein, partial [Chitinophaga sp.]